MPFDELVDKMRPQIDEGGLPVGGGMFGQSPVGHAMNISANEGWLPGVAALMRNAIPFRGGVEPPGFGELGQGASAWVQKLVRTIARSATKNPELQKDLEQAGFEGLTRASEAGKAHGTGAVRRDMDDFIKQQNPGGIRDSVAGRMGKAEAGVAQNQGAAVGPENEMALYGKYRETLRPADRAKLTLDKFREMRQRSQRQEFSTENLAGPKGNKTLGETLASGEASPEEWAMLEEKFRSLTPQQQENIARSVTSGQLDVNPAIKARILKKWMTPEISGGSGAGRPLPPGAYDAQQIMDTKPGSGPFNLTIRQAMSNPETAGIFHSGNPMPAETAGLEASAIPISPTDLFSNKTNMLDQVPPGINPGATIYDLINHVRTGLAAGGRN